MSNTFYLARLIWSYRAAGNPEPLTAAGDSGGYTFHGDNTPRSAVDLQTVQQVWLSAHCAGAAGTSPSLTVALDGYDAAGNLVPGLVTLAALTAAGATYKALTECFPPWGRVSWTVSGTTPSFTGVEISLYGR